MNSFISKRKRILSLVIVFGLLASFFAQSLVFANDYPTTRANEVPEDGVYDNWVQDSTTKVGGEVNEVTDDGWLHLASERGNGNNPVVSRQPAVFVNEDFTMAEEGFFEFTYKSLKAPATNRFGIYFNYDDPGNAFMVGSDMSGWFWQRYKAYGGSDYGSGSKLAVAPEAGQAIKVRFEWSGKKITKATVDGVDILTTTPFDFTNIGGDGLKIAIKAGSFSNGSTIDDITDIYLKDIHYTGQKTVTACDVSGKIVDEDNNAVSGANVALSGGATVNSGADGSFNFTGVKNGSYSITASKIGFETKNIAFTVAGEDVLLEDTKLIKTKSNITVLSTDLMDVEVDLDFPRVVKYVMKESSKVMQGQPSVLEAVEINSVSIKPTVTSKIVGENKVEYQLTLKDDVNNVDAVLSAEIIVSKNNLTFNITKVVNNLNNFDFPVETINIPRHNLVSVRSSDTNANFKGANLSTNTTSSGDVGFEITDERSASTAYHMYGFISNDQLSAGLWSNTEFTTGGSGDGGNKRVSVYTEKKDGFTSVGLGSSYWYYHRKISAKTEVEVVKQREMPSAKIVIADDENGDSKIDWQDGAIAFRTIMNNAVGSEKTPELVARRIAMNFGGQAQNPFLQSLDNVKKVALHTDGLGQWVILKGYGNEGHDSAHPDFYDIGKRIGGADDMVKLLKEGKQFGANFGIHINTGEMYPEADAFSEDLVRRNADGTMRYGWNWIDQGVGIDGRYDLIMSERGNELGRQDRLQKLYDIVGDDLDFVYLDIWGNQTSGVEDAWDTRKVTNDINKHGWTFVTEFPSASEYDAVFHHWATDLAYGGFETKGHNSNVIRFLRNHQKDSWNADYTPHNGAAIAPLLGGYNMKDFEGWQGRNNYDDYIDNIFRHNIVTKFLQHYEAMQWENGTAVTIGGKSWTPEMKITLEDNRRENTVVVERGSNNYAADLSGYRSRNITLNGKQILKGEMARGDRNSTNTDGRGSETYLIPWIWDSETGDFVSSEAEKLYHWNILGGTTTWDLPNGWETLENVKLYKLTDLGKTEEVVIPVMNGKITITNAVASQPYVVYKGEAADQLEIKWSVGMHIVDAGFNSGKLDNWTATGAGSATIARSQYSNPMLMLSGEKSMTQTLTDLTPGQKYAVYVGVDNRSDSKAHITLKSGETVLDTNYTTRSIAKNYIKANAHNTNSSTVGGTSYFQNLYVFFTAPATGDVTLTLSRETGTGDTYFDDVRIAKTEADNITKDSSGNVTKFEQDFENNPQGIYPFVMGGVEGVEDNRTHLSELNAPYTQAGWDVKKMDDVLGGEWSLKTNGLVARSRLLYQTVPQNFRFEAGKTYKIKFNYQMGSEGTYAFVVGNGEYVNITNLDQFNLQKSLGTTATFEYNVVGAESGQTWIGIYSTAVAADLQGSTGAAQNFGGYKDIVLDNLVIEEKDYDTSNLSSAISDANKKVELDYSKDSWTPFAQALSHAMSLMTEDELTQNIIDSATESLVAKTKNLELVYTSIKGKVTNGDGEIIVGATIRLSASNFVTKNLTTDINGEFSLADTNVRDFTMQTSYNGYYSSTHSFRPTAGKTFVRDVIMVKIGVADYTNNFDDGDVSNLKNFKENANQIVVSSVEHEGGKAALVKFPGGRANLYDSASPMFINGTFEAEVTPKGNSARFGLQMRAVDNSNRVFAGVGDSGGLYFWEYWNNSSNSYSGMSNGVNMQADTTYKIKMEVTGSTIRLWVDGTLIVNANAADVHQRAGFVGFENRNASSFIIDNIAVTSYDKSYVAGYVTNIDNEAIENVSVELYDKVKRAPIASSITDAKGKYNLGVIQAGDYSIKVSKENYLPITQDVSIVGSNVVGSENFTLLLESVEPADKEDLGDVIIYALEQKASAEYAHVVPAVKAAFEKAISDAQAVFANENATQTAVDKAYDDLLAMVQMLSFTGNPADLKALVELAEAINLALYTDSSAKAVTDAVDAANLILGNENSLQEDIDEAKEALQSAIDALVLKPIVDKSALERKIAEGDKIDLEKYLTQGQDAFKTALENAKTVRDDANATQAEVKKAHNDLRDAIFKLRLKPDKSKLEELINKAKNIDTDKYTKNSVAALNSAVAKANDVVSNENSAANEVLAAENSVKKALDGLVLLSGGGETTTTTTDKNTTKTGESKTILPSLGVIVSVAMLTAIAIVRVRKKKIR